MLKKYLIRIGLAAATLLLGAGGQQARAQAPGWQAVSPIVNTTSQSYSEVLASATDANGNVLVAGRFWGTVTLGSTTLTCPKGFNTFVAKWSPATSSFVWAYQVVAAGVAGAYEANLATSLVVSGGNIYLAGVNADDTDTFGTIVLTRAGGGTGGYVAKLTDAGSSASFVWVKSINGLVQQVSVAVSGSSVYATGAFSGSNVTAGTTTIANKDGILASTTDIFLTKLTDAGSTASFAYTQTAGGTGSDYVSRVAVSGSNVYLTGNFDSASAQFGSYFATGGTFNGSYYTGYISRFADLGVLGTFSYVTTNNVYRYPSDLVVSGSTLYVASRIYSNPLTTTNDGAVSKYTDTGTTATNVWTLMPTAGAPLPTRLALSGSKVLVAGYFNTPTAGLGTTTFNNLGNTNNSGDIFLARITDAGTTASYDWAQQAGGTSNDQATTLAVSGSSIFVGGTVIPPALFGTQAITSNFTSATGFVTVATDATLAPALPTVSSLAPTTGVAGTTVTLTGTNLTGTTAVSFNGVAATSFNVVSATSLTAVVPVGATTGSISVTTANGTGSSGSFTVRQPAVSRILLDGYRETRYGTAQALQTAATGFGNATNGSPTQAVSGSELDAAYTYVHGDSLYVFLAGNLENNGNTLEVFFDTQSGGQNVLTNPNPTVDGNALGTMAGLRFDAGFAPDYYFTIRGVTSGGVAQASFAGLGAGGASTSPASVGTGQVMTLNLPGGRTGTLAVDQSNTGGIDTNTANAGVAGAVVTGLEFVLPLAAIGSPSGTLRMTAFVNGSSHDYLSNQVLAGLPAGTTNLATASSANFASAANAGDQFFNVALPVVAPQVSGLSPGSGAVGSTVTISGVGLGYATSVSFNGVAASFVVVNGTTLTATVPAGATAGVITVTTSGGGAATSVGSFCVQYAATTAGASRCGAGTVTLTASGAPAGGTYSFYGAASGGTALGTGSSFTTPSLTSSTTYYVAIGTGSGATGCEGTRTAVTATINALPTVTVGASGATTFCAGNSVTLTASGADRYEWSGGQTTASIAVNAAGTYSVTGYTAAGCSAVSSSITVTVNATPATPTITQNTGSPRVLTSSATTGNQWYLNGVAIAGATGQTYQATTAGTYTVVATSAAGCASASSNQLSVVLATQSALAAQVQLYPNPAHDRVVLTLPGRTGHAVLLNALGQVVRATPVAGATELDLTGLARGLYVIRLEVGSEILTKHLVLD